MSFTFSAEWLDEVDSTMTVARERARAGAPTGAFVVARSQRVGRGRLGRPWFAPPGAALLTTVVLRPKPRPDGSALTLVGLVCGLAACDAVRSLGVSEARLKWPNDVVVGDRKLCGILVEAEDVAGPAPLALAGFGVNLASRAALALPADLEERYVGLADLLPDDPPDVTRALEALSRELSAGYRRWLAGGAAPVIEAFGRVDALRGLEVRADAPGGPIVGRADGLTPEGGLRLLTPLGVKDVLVGDVTRIRTAFPLESRGPRP